MWILKMVIKSDYFSKDIVGISQNLKTWMNLKLYFKMPAK